MRCAELDNTWGELESWFVRTGVLVLPIFRGSGPLVRFDDDLAPSREATDHEMGLVVARLRSVVERFDLRAVYVHRTTWDADNDWMAGAGADRALTQLPVPLATAAELGLSRPGPLTRVMLRVFAGGVIHELLLVAGWYAALEDGASDLYAPLE
jgi:hypothetical protein